MTPALSPKLNLVTQHVWGDEMDDPTLSKWIQDTFEDDDLHRTGYSNLKKDGSIDPNLDGIEVAGRHACLMNDHREKVQYIENGHLVFRPHVVKTFNPYRKDIIGRDGINIPFSQYIPYTSWLSTWTRKWSNEHNRHITDFDKTTFTFGRGHVIECRINAEDMIANAIRYSMWLMCATEAGEDTPENPAKVLAGTEYDANPKTGEVDGPEIENPSEAGGEFGNLAFMKVIGGQAGDTPEPQPKTNNGQSGYNLLEKFNINLRKGWHTFTIVWGLDGNLYFYCDGELVNTDYRGLDMNAYLILSAEMCSGLKDPAHGNIEPHENTIDGPKAPLDAGLSARCWLDSLHLIDKHRVLIDYVRVFKILGTVNDTPASNDATIDNSKSTPSKIQLTENTKDLFFEDHDATIDISTASQLSDLATLCGNLEIQNYNVRAKLTDTVKALSDMRTKYNSLAAKYNALSKRASEETKINKELTIAISKLQADREAQNVEVVSLQNQIVKATVQKTDTVDDSVKRRVREILKQAKSRGML